MGFHPVDLQLGVQGLPQLDVDHRLAVGLAPAFALPAFHPGLDALHHVLAVGIERDLAGAAQGAQPFDGRPQLHAVVGGAGLGPVGLLFLGSIGGVDPQQVAPAARSGVAQTGAVAVELDSGAGKTRAIHSDLRTRPD